MVYDIFTHSTPVILICNNCVEAGKHTDTRYNYLESFTASWYCLRLATAIFCIVAVWVRAWFRARH
jgi:hypothetical protein